MHDPPTAGRVVVIESRAVASRTEIAAENGMCVGGHVESARAGARTLAEGGNAVDALLASAFTSYVVEPWNCGIGGYGHLSVYLAERDELVTIDHHLRAPLAASADMYEVDESAGFSDYDLPRVVGRHNVELHRSVGVPGAVAGLCAAHELFGRLPLPQVLAPAIEAAEAGLPANWELLLAVSRRGELLRRTGAEHAAGLLLPGGAPPAAGARLDLSDLARTLRLIAASGAAGFYDGPVAEAIAMEVARGGGIVTRADLAAYRPRILRERRGRYRDLEYVAGFDQIANEALNILACFDVAALDPHGVEFRHLMAEALGLAFTDSIRHYGDPDVVASPVNGLASEAFGRARAADISFEHAGLRPIAAGDPWPYEDGAERPERLEELPSTGGIAGTSQVVTADGEGNMTALCTTVSHAFGSGVLVPGFGFLLNDGMHNFDARPGRPNSIAPGKMPLFAAPALIATRNGRGVVTASGSGGYRITTGVLHPFVGVVDHGMAMQAAIDHPRVHCQGSETFVDARIPPEVRNRLAELGHRVVVEENDVASRFGRTCAIHRDAAGVLHSGSNPLFSTAAAGI